LTIAESWASSFYPSGAARRRAEAEILGDPVGVTHRPAAS